MENPGGNESDVEGDMKEIELQCLLFNKDFGETGGGESSERERS